MQIFIIINRDCIHSNLANTTSEILENGWYKYQIAERDLVELNEYAEIEM